MWTVDKDFPARGFSTPPPTAKSRRWSPGLPMRPLSEKKRSSPQGKADLFHVVHKVPAGDSPYVRAKHVQLIDKDPNKAISLFWGAINSGDRVDSALKDMAVVMKQLNRSDEAIEAIKSFRHLCPPESQESLDNLLVELYKRSGRIEEQIEMLQLKVKKIEEGIAFGGKRIKSARSQGKKIQITVEQEYSRLLGNLAWAYLQRNNFKFAEELYRKALSLETDKNKQCNLAICLMHMNKITEAKFLLQTIQASHENGPIDDSYARSFERATQMLTELDSQSTEKPIARQEESHKGGSYRENSIGRRADVGSKRNSKWVSSNGMEVGSFSKKPYASPVPAMGFPKVPYTQPRRSLQSFVDAEQRKMASWKNGFVGGSSSKLSFEQPTADETSKVALQNSESGSSCFRGDWRKMSWGNLAEQNNVVTEPAEEVLSGQDCGRSSNFSITNGLTVTETIVDNCVRGLSSQNPDSSCEPAAENVKQLHDNSLCKTKKTWADMVEEDEQEVSKGRTDYPESEWAYPCQDLSCQTPHGGSDGLSSGEESEEFNDENMDSNINNNQNLTTPDQIENLSKKFKVFDLKDGYCTQPENAASSTNQTARRSLCFDQLQHPGGADNYCSSPLPKKALNFESYNNPLLVDEGREHPSGSGIKLLRRNRLQVFRDITRFSDSPGL